ncbi:hypothetical protein ACJZ2D_000590 [Fusarium nematophilum]
MTGAADGYARIKGLGVIVTTFGVRELSALNAIAGAYGKRAVVVHIISIPSRVTQESKLLVHHTFNDGEYGRFAEIYRHVTVAQTRLWDTGSIPEQIDWALQQCLLQNRSVYVEAPIDLVDTHTRGVKPPWSQQRKLRYPGNSAIHRQADLILWFGPHYSSTNTFLFSSIPDPKVTISFSDTEHVYWIHAYHDSKDQLISFLDVPRDGQIDRASLWRLLGNLLRPGDIFMAETGTAAYGARQVPLPAHAKCLGPVTRLSIGFQMTAQELSNMIRYGLNVVVFLIINEGYTIERCIPGLKQRYNGIASCRYLKAPRFFGAPGGTFTPSNKTWSEVEDVLQNENLCNGPGVRMAVVIMDREDAPEGPLLQYMEKQRKRLQE